MGRRSRVWAQSRSLARSEVPITRHSILLEASAIICALRMLRGVSIIAQMAIESGAPLATMMFSSCLIASALSTLGSRMAWAPLAAAAATSAYPQGVASPLQTVSPGLYRIAHLMPGLLLGIRRNGILQIEYQAVGRDRPPLLQCPGIGTGHIKNASARPCSVRHDSNLLGNG